MKRSGSTGPRAIGSSIKFSIEEEYPGVINMMDSTLELMKSKKAKKVTDNCEFRLRLSP